MCVCYLSQSRRKEEGGREGGREGGWKERRREVGSRVVVIEFWHGFMDYNYLSLNRQLLPITTTKVAYR